jgi:predicted ATP-grasp superfamily ATP-dependent carboligase
VNTQALYKYIDLEVRIPSGLKLLAGLNGFTDAGGSISQVSDSIFALLDSELVIKFDNDQLLDYRSRRPSMYFEKDHIASYEPAVLGLYLCEDEAGQQFLFLHGYEPDFKWDAFAEAILDVVKELEISEFVWVHSIPFPVPHTRPLGVTVSGNRRDLAERFSEWRPETQVPGNVLHLLEYNLTKSELPCTGFVLLVPHYISDSEYPKVAVTAFELISAATGLVFPTDDLREQNIRFESKLDKQVSENADLARMVENLEQGYQSERNAPMRATVNPVTPVIPSADDLAADIEEYLATRRRNKTDGEEN